jgi:NuA3 HAT complex component NTO1
LDIQLIVHTRLDKKVFEDGLTKLQSKLEDRFYTTTLHFAQDLCGVFHAGINNNPRPRSETHRKLESADGSPVKQSYAEPRDRKRLGKRILKSLQPQLEAALRAEANITNKPLDVMMKDLDRMLEASWELQQASITVSQAEIGGQGNEDVAMEDAPGQEITVASCDNNDEDGAQQAGEENVDAMDTGEDDEPKAESNIEVNTSGLEPSVEEESKEEEEHVGNAASEDVPMTNGITDLETPPATNGYVGVQRPNQPAPPTPPQSNGSLSGAGKEAADPLTDGGVPWYLKMFDPQGVSAVEPQWAGRNAVRSLSEDLSEIDDDELTGLGRDVDADTITASPNGGEVTADTIVSAAVKSSNNGKSRAKSKRTRTSGRKR